MTRLAVVNRVRLELDAWIGDAEEDASIGDLVILLAAIGDAFDACMELIDETAET